MPRLSSSQDVFPTFLMKLRKCLILSWLPRMDSNHDKVNQNLSGFLRVVSGQSLFLFGDTLQFITDHFRQRDIDCDPAGSRPALILDQSTRRNRVAKPTPASFLSYEI